MRRVEAHARGRAGWKRMRWGRAARHIIIRSRAANDFANYIVNQIVVMTKILCKPVDDEPCERLLEFEANTGLTFILAKSETRSTIVDGEN